MCNVPSFHSHSLTEFLHLFVHSALLRIYLSMARTYAVLDNTSTRVFCTILQIKHALMENREILTITQMRISVE